MTLLERLGAVARQVSFGDFRPRVSVEVVTKETSSGSWPAVLVGVDTVDSEGGGPMRLFECHVAPDLPERELALWVKERCQDLLLHEMDEFFRFRGAPLEVPVHPVVPGTFDAVRRRSA